MKAAVDGELAKYAFESSSKQDIQKNLYAQIDKAIKKYDENDVKVNYTKRENEKAGFKSEIKSVLNEKVAEENRGYLLSQFDNVKSVTFQSKKDNKKEIKTIQIDETEKAHFENMLDETTGKNVNTLALAVGKDPSILQELRVKVKEKGEDKNSIAFSNANIVYATKPEDIKKVETSLDTKVLYTKQLEATKTSNAIETAKAPIIAKIQEYINNTSKETLEIQVPNDMAYDQMTTIINDVIGDKDLGLSGKAIALNKVTNINTIKIISKEIKETPGNISLNLKRLEANAIADRSGKMINDLLAKSDPQMKAILENQNYKITGGSVYGSASKNFTTYTNDIPFLL